MTIVLRGVGFFGKVPSAGDFQRQVTADGPDGRTLDWFNDGWTKHALAGRRPDLGSPVAFCWQRPGSDVALVGLMVASRDRAGRRFPLLVFGAVSGADRTADVLASAHEFYERAETVADAGRAGVEVAALRAHIESLRTTVDPDGMAGQTAWQNETRATEWAGDADVAERVRSLRFAFSGGGRPNFVLRGRWQGDLRHFAAGVDLLQRLSRAAPAMLFWTQADGVVSWRAAWEYAVPSLFEPLMWHDVQAATAFDTDPGAVAVPAAFVVPALAPDARLSDLLAAS